MRSGPRVPWQVKYVVLALIWGSSFLLMKVGLRSLTAVQISTVRILSGSAVLLVLLAATRGRLPRDRRVWGHLIVCGVFLAALPFTMFALSETRVSSALAGIGNSTTPIATVLATMALVPDERVPRRKILGIALGFLGVVTITQPWAAAGRPDLLGFAMALVGGASYGVGWTYNRKYLAGADLGGLSQPAALMLVGAILIVPVLLVSWLLDRSSLPTPWSYAAHGTGLHAWLPLLAVLVLGVVSTGFAYMLNFDVIRGAGPVVGSTMTYFIPCVSVVLGVLVLDEHLGWAEVVGFAVVLVAAYVINARPRERLRV